MPLTSADPGWPNGGAVFHDTAVWIKQAVRELIVFRTASVRSLRMCASGRSRSGAAWIALHVQEDDGRARDER